MERSNEIPAFELASQVWKFSRFLEPHLYLGRLWWASLQYIHGMFVFGGILSVPSDLPNPFIRIILTTGTEAITLCCVSDLSSCWSRDDQAN